MAAAIAAQSAVSISSSNRASHSRSHAVLIGLERQIARRATRCSLQQQQSFVGSSCNRTQRRLRLSCSASVQDAVPAGSVSLVLLAGGVGKRMGASIPKQYLELQGQPIATYSLRTFVAMPTIREVVVVCEPEWRDIFQRAYATLPRRIPLKFASPGAERQDSVYNGFQEIEPEAQLVAIHDSARPLITATDAAKCFADALKVGAAVLGVPVKPTIKEVDGSGRVVKTLQRSRLWEVQTPQVIRPALLRAGFELVKREGLEVTDDVSIVEALGEPVTVTPGSYTNIKVTTPDDMSVAERFLQEAAKELHAAAARV